MWLALTSLVIAQLPLTFGNSVVATVDAEREYFGNAARRVTEDRMAWSIAGSNLVSGIFHGLPICHGAGGVTAHYKLGARTAGATLMVGGKVLYRSSNTELKDDSTVSLPETDTAYVIFKR